MSHTLSGKTFGQRLQAAGLNTAAGENIAMGQTTPEAAMIGSLRFRREPIRSGGGRDGRG